ncbi:hypothetical protein OL233_01035 [Vagococcus sp. PNs007]|uniref:DUF4355 domain-containing protein n=1 Tax=Vagococcus proximus TaxID=2991417 RepID=A0ABT5WYM7_9ENTE|nr:hypothetical protein [Vagococcus proximus]MDF0478858.1 hypothetical protein [Vagococcus proximus]
MGLLTDLLGATGLNENRKEIYLEESGQEPQGTAQEAIQKQLQTLDRAARGIPLEAGQKAAVDITERMKKAARNGETKVTYDQPSLDDILGSIFGEKTVPKVEQHNGVEDVFGDILGEIGKELSNKGAKTKRDGRVMSIDLSDIMDSLK